MVLKWLALTPQRKKDLDLIPELDRGPFCVESIYYTVFGISGLFCTGFTVTCREINAAVLMCLTPAASHLSISLLHRWRGCSWCYCGGRRRSGSGWTRVRSTGRVAARSLPCLDRTAPRVGRTELGRSPAADRPRLHPAGPSRGHRRSPTHCT